MNLPRIAVRSLIFVCLVSSTTLLAQAPTAVVNGTVVDPSGASVPEAKVTVVNQETSVVSQKTEPGGCVHHHQSFARQLRAYSGEERRRAASRESRCRYSSLT